VRVRRAAQVDGVHAVDNRRELVGSMKTKQCDGGEISHHPHPPVHGVIRQIMDEIRDLHCRTADALWDAESKAASGRRKWTA
jgi:hypothetical protein